MASRAVWKTVPKVNPRGLCVDIKHRHLKWANRYKGIRDDLKWESARSTNVVVTSWKRATGMLTHPWTQVVMARLVFLCLQVSMAPTAELQGPLTLVGNIALFESHPRARRSRVVYEIEAQASVSARHVGQQARESHGRHAYRQGS